MAFSNHCINLGLSTSGLLVLGDIPDITVLVRLNAFGCKKQSLGLRSLLPLHADSMERNKDTVTKTFSS